MSAKGNQALIIRGREESQFLTISNELAQNTSITRAAKGLLVEILSRPADWRVSLAQLKKDGIEGRDAIRTMLKELVAAGYIKVMAREREQGKFGKWLYYVYSSPQAANCESEQASDKDGFVVNGRTYFKTTSDGFSDTGSTSVGFSGTGSTGTGESDPTNTYSTNTESTNTEESKSSCPPSEEADVKLPTQEPADEVPQQKNSSGKRKYRYDPEGIEVALAKHMLECIRKRDPEYKEPNIQVWAREMDLMLRLDGRTPEEIKKLSGWSQKDSFWCKNVLCPEKLRKQFDRLRAEINSEGDEYGNGFRTRGSRYEDDRFRPKSDGAPYPAPEVF